MHFNPKLKPVLWVTLRNHQHLKLCLGKCCLWVFKQKSRLPQDPIEVSTSPLKAFSYVWPRTLPLPLFYKLNGWCNIPTSSEGVPAPRAFCIARFDALHFSVHLYWWEWGWVCSFGNCTEEMSETMLRVVAVHWLQTLMK